MTRTVLTLLSVPLFACQEEPQQESTLPFESTTSWELLDQNDDVDLPEPLVEQPDLICTTGGIFDQAGDLHTLRMELFQREGSIELHAQKGALHPVGDAQSPTNILMVPGTIGEEFLRLDINEETNISDEFSLDISLAMELGLSPETDQLFYQGIFTQFGCGIGNYNSVTCWDPNIEPEFTYSTLDGVCLNKQNEVGLNPWTLEMIRETHDGQCAQLDWMELSEGSPIRPELSWDLRGSSLEYSYLSSATLNDAQLEGAQMDTLYYWDASISGSIDDFTTLPEGCEENQKTLSCSR